MVRKRIDVVAYTAGILDGEGSIQINPSKRSKDSQRYWALTIQVSSGCEEMLQFLKKEWGVGSITSWKPKGKKKYRRSYNWRLGSKASRELLTSVLPYLQIKHENAELALEFGNYVAAKKGGLTKAMSKQRSRIALKLRKLNQKYGKGVVSQKSFADVL